jgi:hypothetical protein
MDMGPSDTEGDCMNKNVHVRSCALCEMGWGKRSSILQVEAKFHIISAEGNLRLSIKEESTLTFHLQKHKLHFWPAGTDSQMQLLTPALLTESSINSHRMGTVCTQWRTGAATWRTKSHLLILARIFLTAVSLSWLWQGRISCGSTDLAIWCQQYNTLGSSNNEKPQMRSVFPPLITLRCDRNSSRSLPSPLFTSGHTVHIVTQKWYPNFLKFCCWHLSLHFKFMHNAREGLWSKEPYLP